MGGMHGTRRVQVSSTYDIQRAAAAAAAVLLLLSTFRPVQCLSPGSTVACWYPRQFLPYTIYRLLQAYTEEGWLSARRG